jgi:hypothetical protein
MSTPQLEALLHELKLSAMVFHDYGIQHTDKADNSVEIKNKRSSMLKAARNFDRAVAIELAILNYEHSIKE